MNSDDATAWALAVGLVASATAAVATLLAVILVALAIVGLVALPVAAGLQTGFIAGSTAVLAAWYNLLPQKPRQPRKRRRPWQI